MKSPPIKVPNKDFPFVWYRTYLETKRGMKLSKIDTTGRILCTDDELRFSSNKTQFNINYGDIVSASVERSPVTGAVVALALFGVTANDLPYWCTIKHKGSNGKQVNSMFMVQIKKTNYRIMDNTALTREFHNYVSDRYKKFQDRIKKIEISKQCEKALNYGRAADIYEDLGMWDNAKRCRKLANPKKEVNVSIDKSIKISDSVVNSSSIVTGEDAEKDVMNICPYCGKELKFKKQPKFCPFCKEEF